MRKLHAPRPAVLSSSRPRTPSATSSVLSPPFAQTWRRPHVNRTPSPRTGDLDTEHIEMVQTYGVAPPDDSEPSGAGGETSALLGDDRAPVHTHHGRASLTSSISNLTNTIIGSGMLTFPMAMASAGVIPGVITCVFSGFVAGFGLYLLSLSAAKSPPRHASWTSIAHMTYPRAAVFFDAAIAAKCFGVSISYLIILKRLMPKVASALFDDISAQKPPAWMSSERTWLCIALIILFPLGFLRRLDSLRHTSYISLFAVVYLVLIVITCYFWPVGGMTPKGDVYLVHFTPKFITTFPVQVFAFTCAQNLLPIINEVADNSQKRVSLIISSAIGSATLTYEIVAIFGYLTFGSEVAQNIIEEYPSSSLFIAVGQLAIAILVLFSYPLQVHPCRNCIGKIFHAGGQAPRKATRSVEADDSDSDDEDDHAPSDMPTFLHALISFLVMAGGFAIAFFVSDLQLVLSFVGSTGSTTISFILPGLFYWKISQNDPSARRMHVAAAALTLYGAFVFVFCLGFSIYDVVDSAKA